MVSFTLKHLKPSRKAFRFGAKHRDGETKVIDNTAIAAEFLATCFLVIFGCGSAVANGAFDGATRLLVAFSFGMTILVMIYAIAKHSGGQINPAVTLSLMLGGRVTWYQGVPNILAQVAGSLLGALFLWGIFPCSEDQTKYSLGSNVISDKYSVGQAFLGEFLLTSLLCFVIWETAVSTKSTCGNNAAIAIGFAVFLCHIILLPIDGCSINPARSIGPAVISYCRTCPSKSTPEKALADLWVFIVAPFLGGIFAALLQIPFYALPPDQLAKEEVCTDPASIESGYPAEQGAIVANSLPEGNTPN